MNGFDYLVLGITAIGFWLGFRRGLIMELALLAGLILAVFGASYVARFIEDWLLQNTDFGGVWLPRLSFILALAAIYTGAWFVGKFLSTAASLMLLGLLNRIAGGFFGSLKYIVFICVILALLSGSSLGQWELIRRSKTASMLINIGTKLSPGIEQIGRNTVNLPEILPEAE